MPAAIDCCTTPCTTASQACPTSSSSSTASSARSTRAKLPNGIKPAVFLIDIDRFMELEERVGHSAADSVLLAISRRVARIMRPLDTVARVSQAISSR